MEEKEILNEVNGSGKDKVRRILMYIGWGLSAILLVCGIMLISRVMKLNVLTTPYMVILIASVIVVTGVIAFLQKWMVPGIITKIIAIAMSVIMVIGSRYLGATSKALDKMSGMKTQIDNVCVYVLKDSTYESLDDLKDATFGISQTIDRTNTDKALDMIVSEIKTSLVPKEYQGAMQLIDALYNKEVDAIVLNSSFLSVFEGVDNYSDVEDRIRSVWSAEIKTDIVDNNNNNNNNEEPTSDPYDQYKNFLYGGDDVFTLYVSGIDTNGSPMVNRNSDVNILITVNTKTRQILMINTPRDFYVPLSISNGVKDKLTHAGCYGIQVSVDTLEMLYGVNIDDYIKINFTGFVDVINQLGGVNVYSDYDFTAISGNHYNKGYNQLTGEEALHFARERHAFGSGDRQRGKNQMAVIKAIIDKCTSSDALLNYENLLNAVSSSIATSMSSDEITDLIKMQLSDMKGWDIQTYSVDGKGDNLMTFSLTAPNYVMVPTQSTVDMAKEYLRQIYTGETVKVQ